MQVMTSDSVGPRAVRAVSMDAIPVNAWPYGFSALSPISFVCLRLSERGPYRPGIPLSGRSASTMFMTERGWEP